MEQLIRHNDPFVDLVEKAIDEFLEPVDCPLRHIFTPGLYVREILIPKGTLLTSQIHNTCHPFTISKGHISVLTDGEDEQLLFAPYTGITYPGTRRILFAHEDVIWTTYHPTDIVPTDQTPEAVEIAVQKIKDLIIEKHDNLLLQQNKKEELCLG